MLSTFSSSRIAGALTGAAITLGVVGAASAAGQNMRAADAVDAAHQVAATDAPGATTQADVRTPDARGSSRAASPISDRRSPDVRKTPAPPHESQPVSDTQPSSGGFDLLSAAIGAAAGTGLLLVLAAFLATGGLTGRRRHGSLRV
jgi:hypothetical protein